MESPRKWLDEVLNPANTPTYSNGVVMVVIPSINWCRAVLLTVAEGQQVTNTLQYAKFQPQFRWGLQ